MTCAITGAAGFIGSRLLEAWARVLPASELLAVDHPYRESRAANLAVAPGVRFLDHRAFLGGLESGTLEPELILHMGACSSTLEADWAYLAENNLGYSRRLWEWCARHRSRLIYASSAATYGDGSLGFDDRQPIRRLRPLNLYGRSKHEFDLWVEDQAAVGRPGPAQCVGLKFFNVFGPGETHKGRMASMAFHGWRQCRDQGVVRLFRSDRPDFADGGQLRDFVYVHDVVAAIRALADRPGVSGLFNLGTGRAESFRGLAEALFRAMGREPRIEYIPMPDDLLGRYQYFTEASMGKLRGEGVPLVFRSLQAALDDYVGWLSEWGA